MPDDLPRDDPPVAGPAAGAQAAAPLGGDSAGCGAEHGLRAGAGAGGDDSRDTRPDRATRFVETTLGVLSYTQLAPLLAERVTRLEAALLAQAFAPRPLDESLLTEFHARICGDLTPEWAGKWRAFPGSIPLPAIEKPLPPGITVVIPSRNGRQLLSECLPLVMAQKPSEVIVVDNGSDDGTTDWEQREYFDFF